MSFSVVIKGASRSPTLWFVGRKTANLIVGDLYGKPALVCDTHVIRASGRLGLTDGTKDALKVEKQLAAIIKPDDRLMMCHRLVWGCKVSVAFNQVLIPEIFLFSLLRKGLE